MTPLNSEGTPLSQESLSDFLHRCVNTPFSIIWGLVTSGLSLSLTILQKYIESTPMASTLLLARNGEKYLTRTLCSSLSLCQMTKLSFLDDADWTLQNKE